jgi:hypothetical protein
VIPPHGRHLAAYVPATLAAWALLAAGCSGSSPAGRASAPAAAPVAASTAASVAGGARGARVTRFDVTYSGPSAGDHRDDLWLYPSSGALYLIAIDGVHQIDPASGRDLRRIAVSGAVGWAVAVLDGRMYLGTKRPTNDGVTAFAVVTIDLVTGTTVGRTQVPDDKMLQGIAVIRNKVTVAYGANGGFRLATLEDGRLAAGGTIPDTDTTGLDYADGSIWEVDHINPRVRQVDADTGAVRQEWKLPGATGFGLVRIGSTRYVSTEDGNDNYSLVALDPGGTSRTVCPLGPVGLLAVDGTTLWRASRGALSQVDISAGTVTRRAPLPDASIDDVTVSGGAVWIAGHDNSGAPILLRYRG